jgi:hypothetical protein
MGGSRVVEAALLKEIDAAMLYALSSLGDMDSVLELGHFGNMTHGEAIVRLKKARKDLPIGRMGKATAKGPRG